MRQLLLVIGKIILISLIGFIYNSCRSNDSNNKINQLEEENKELKLRKENIELQKQLSDIESSKQNEKYEQLVRSFENDRDKDIEKYQIEEKKGRISLEKEQIACNCEYNKKSQRVVFFGTWRFKTPWDESIFVLHSTIQGQAEENIDYFKSRKYRSWWMAQHGYVESEN